MHPRFVRIGLYGVKFLRNIWRSLEQTYYFASIVVVRELLFPESSSWRVSMRSASHTTRKKCLKAASF